MQSASVTVFKYEDFVFVIFYDVIALDDMRTVAHLHQDAFRFEQSSEDFSDVRILIFLKKGFFINDFDGKVFLSFRVNSKIHIAIISATQSLQKNKLAKHDFIGSIDRVANLVPEIAEVVGYLVFEFHVVVEILINWN
jgi:hypothetical protein